MCSAALRMVLRGQQVVCFTGQEKKQDRKSKLSRIMFDLLAMQRNHMHYHEAKGTQFNCNLFISEVALFNVLG